MIFAVMKVVAREMPELGSNPDLCDVGAVSYQLSYQTPLLIQYFIDDSPPPPPNFSTYNFFISLFFHFCII